MMRTAIRGTRPKVAFAHDLVMAAVSLPLSLFLRLGDYLAYYDLTAVVQMSALFTLIAGLVFWSMRLYSGVWRYASLNDLHAIIRAVTLAILIFLPLMFLITRLETFPRSTLIINWFVLMGLLGGPRFVYRLFKDRRAERTQKRDGGRQIPVLLVGAGDAAEQFIRAMTRTPHAAYQVVGIVDEKGTRVGRNIRGIHVLGDIEGIPLVAERLARDGRRPQRLIITKDRIEGASVQRILELAESIGATLARLPSLTDFRSSMGDEIVIKPVDVEDLLGRPQAVLDRASMKALIHGKRVLVTGAGGTIGSELARQVAAFGPARIAMIDASEFHLYEIDLELDERFPDLDRKAILADVRDAGRIQRIVADEAPEIVFHAAALKHVPVVEAHAEEGALTNTVGTRVVADACRANDVAAMVLISTDKAINPTSLMGATKRIAESYCQALDISESSRPGGTRFAIVRFGNVLGSTGSVVPLFQRQLARGGPLTVTHPDMTRYFMTVREAVELVIEASVLGLGSDRRDGEVYVLDMGEPVRIIDLARQMILLAGLEPDVDIRIEITGPRPGEKLFEEVVHDTEGIEPTAYPGILRAAPRTVEPALLARALDEMETAARAGNRDEAVAIVRRLVPEYHPSDEDRTHAASSQ